MAFRIPFAVATTLALLGCGKKGAPPEEAGTVPSAAPSIVSTPSAQAPGVPRPGMVWIPPGVLKAGTPTDRVPRIAEEELPGAEVALAGFYVDELPYPNETGAIPTANVTREEAAAMCESKGKRLCTELEWERACKGEGNRTYEYGDAYRSAICGTGIAVEQAARRPSGERAPCRSTFGVREMHGGVWEWTESTWERGGPTKLAVLRGGNAVAGEIVGRCANALGRPSSTKSQSMGFRCCAGPKNEPRVELAAAAGLGLDALVLPTAKTPWGPAEWRWRPVANEEIRVRGECHDEPPGGISCTCRVFRPAAEGAPPPADLARIETGKALCGVVQPTKDPKDLRMIYMDKAGRSRTVRYTYGRVDVSVPR